MSYWSTGWPATRGPRQLGELAQGKGPLDPLNDADFWVIQPIASASDSGYGLDMGGEGMDTRPIIRVRFPQPRPKVLLVVADHATAETYRVGLMIAGFEVACSQDGEEAMGRITAGGIPDVVVLDLGLPRVDSTRRRRDGLDLLDALDSTRLTDTLLVLAMSNYESGRIAAMERGAKDCLPSQTAASTLVSAIQNMLKQSTSEWSTDSR